MCLASCCFKAAGIYCLCSESKKIKANDIKNHYIYKFKNNQFGGANLFMTSSHLGKFIKHKTKYQDKYFYHLLTDTGKFYINDIQLYDYNSAIENTLDIRNLYL